MDLKKTILRTVLFGLLTEAERIANEQADTFQHSIGLRHMSNHLVGGLAEGL
jgi:hypothetical protein